MIMFGLGIGVLMLSRGLMAVGIAPKKSLWRGFGYRGYCIVYRSGTSGYHERCAYRVNKTMTEVAVSTILLAWDISG